MLEVIVQGGLGNQLFQYAYARSRSNKGCEVFINDYFMHHTKDKYTKRELQLNQFKLSSKISFKGDQKPKRDLMAFLANRLKLDLVVRYSRYYSNRVKGVVAGYFNTELFFANIREELLAEICLKEESKIYKKWKDKILNAHLPCVVHARRGDYLKQGKNPTLNILPSGYYKEALELIPEDATIFAFSDDIDWLMEVLKDRKNVLAVSGEGLSDSEELSVMKYAQYFIIPNSTFSWWGAWLSDRHDKVVIAPKCWFVKSGWWRANRDVVPVNWIRI